jgi:hypothetical protein
MIGDNQHVMPEEIAKIRALDDFDLVMLISEIHDHGWPVARVTLRMMPPDPQFPSKEHGHA